MSQRSAMQSSTPNQFHSRLMSRDSPTRPPTNILPESTISAGLLDQIRTAHDYPSRLSLSKTQTASENGVGIRHLNANLKLDLQKLKEQRQQNDQREKTVTDLKQRMKFNESKATSVFGGASIMKSNLMRADTLMNFRLNENTDTVELKRVLLTLISDTQQTQEILVQRCAKLREMLDLYEARIQFDDMLFLKEKDVQRMNEHIKHLTDSLVTASKNELLLNEKLREMAKCKHDFAMTKSRNDFLEKQNLKLNQEIKDSKQTMSNMKEVEMIMNK